jgi:hypothetical protein
MIVMLSETNIVTYHDNYMLEIDEINLSLRLYNKINRKNYNVL